MVERVLQLLLDQIADHAPRLGAQHVEGVGFVRPVGRALQCEETDLGPVAVGDDEAMVGADDLREGGGGVFDVLALRFRGHRLPASQKRVAAQGRDAQHLNLRWLRRAWPRRSPYRRRPSR